MTGKELLRLLRKNGWSIEHGHSQFIQNRPKTVGQWRLVND